MIDKTISAHNSKLMKHYGIEKLEAESQNELQSVALSGYSPASNKDAMYTSSALRSP